MQVHHQYSLRGQFRVCLFRVSAEPVRWRQLHVGDIKFSSGSMDVDIYLSEGKSTSLVAAVMMGSKDHRWIKERDPETRLTRRCQNMGWNIQFQNDSAFGSS